MSNIIWSSIWLAASLLYVIFARRFDKKLVERQRKKEKPYPSWQSSTTILFTRVICIYWAINSAVYLFLSISKVVSPDSGHIAPEVVYTILLFYGNYISQNLLFVAVPFLTYFAVKNMYYLYYAPILVSNLTEKYLTLYILGRRIVVLS